MNTFSKKNGQLFCVNCLMAEGSVKCGKCRKLISRYDDLGDWRRNVGLWDDHTADADTFGNGLCWCRKCSEEVKTENDSWGSGNPETERCKIAGCPYQVSPYFKAQGVCGVHVKKCQGTVFTHHNGGYKAKHGSTQFIQCTEVANEGDFCEHCKGQTETYQQVKTRIAVEEKSGFEKYKQVRAKAQSWWSTLSNSEQEKELARVFENMKLGKYWASDVKEGCGSGWTCDGSWWTIKNGKLFSSFPHLVPIQIAEEFLQKEIGFRDNLAIEWMSKQITVKDNDKDNLLPPNSATLQPITNSDNKSDNSANPSNSPQPDSEPDKSPESKIKTIKFENKENDSKNSPNKTDNETLIINLKTVIKITLTSEGNLVIEFNHKKGGVDSTSQTIASGQISHNQELQKVKNYLEKNNQTSLSQQELDQIFNKSNKNSVSDKKTTR